MSNRKARSSLLKSPMVLRISITDSRFFVTQVTQPGPTFGLSAGQASTLSRTLLTPPLPKSPVVLTYCAHVLKPRFLALDDPLLPPCLAAHSPATLINTDRLPGVLSLHSFVY